MPILKAHECRDMPEHMAIRCVEVLTGFPSWRLVDMNEDTRYGIKFCPYCGQKLEAGDESK